MFLLVILKVLNSTYVSHSVFCRQILNSHFQAEHFPPGFYQVSAIGLNLDFRGVKNIEYQTKHFSAFIQTDKAIYKADDVIRFRLFAVNSQSLPYSVKGNPEVTIRDPSGNKVKQFSNITFVKGKYENEFLVSSSPPLGSWSVVADIEGQVVEILFKDIKVLTKSLLDYLKVS